MSERDHMALDILNGLCSNPGGPFQANDYNGWGLVNCTVEDVARLSYQLADAMKKASEEALDNIATTRLG